MFTGPTIIVPFPWSVGRSCVVVGNGVGDAAGVAVATGPGGTAFIPYRVPWSKYPGAVVGNAVAVAVGVTVATGVAVGFVAT